MLKRVVIGLALTTAMAVPVPASASVRLIIADGRVWLTADHATIADILAEWSRVGATQMMNAERVRSPQLTLDLRGVPELEALDVIMRSAGGFVAVPRTGGDDPAHLSRFSRVVVVPSAIAGGTAVPATPVPAPAPPAAVRAPVFTDSGAQRVIGPDGQPVADDQEDAPPPSPPQPPAVRPGGSMPPGFSEPPGAAPPKGAPRPGMMPPVVPPRRPGGPTSG
jgi:hypothetical protein